MRNMSPTKIKVLTVSAPHIQDADALMESTFWQWSKDNPMINISQIERSQAFEQDPGAGAWTISLTIMFDLINADDGVKALIFSTDGVVNAWRNYLAAIKAHQEKGGEPTQLDMRIAMSGPLAQLELCFRQIREW